MKKNIIDAAFIQKNSVPVTETGCWLWLPYTTEQGYGHFRNGNGSKILAHRASYLVFSGDIPEGMLVCHKCDTPSCVNPDHLFLGTYEDNNKDRTSKQRSAIGLTNGKLKLNAEALADIMSSKDKYRILAAKHKVSLSYIKSLRCGKRVPSLSPVNIIPQLSRMTSV